MKTTTANIDWNGEQKTVTLKRLSFGEMNQITEEATDVKVINGQPIVKISQKTLKEVSLLKSIVSAPFEINIKNIQDLDPEVGGLLFEKFTEVNSQEQKKE